jgi:hypothetical protein
MQTRDVLDAKQVTMRSVEVPLKSGSERAIAKEIERERERGRNGK